MVNLRQKRGTASHSQALVLHGENTLMVKQYVQRGAIVWNYPGCGIENNETLDEACIR
jgi:8-oxo-dGTP diphosphatase